MIAQPFLENAIHHGLLNKEEGDRCLKIAISLLGDDIKYSIKDNGVGRKMAGDLNRMNKPEHQSYGIQISTDRITMHNGEAASEAIVITHLYSGDKPAGTLIVLYVKADH